MKMMAMMLTAHMAISAGIICALFPIISFPFLADIISIQWIHGWKSTKGEGLFAMGKENYFMGRVSNAGSFTLRARRMLSGRTANDEEESRLLKKQVGPKE